MFNICENFYNAVLHYNNHKFTVCVFFVSVLHYKIYDHDCTANDNTFWFNMKNLIKNNDFY